MDALIWNLRHALRTLLQAPTFLLVVALILGLGIGATTALYSAVDAVLLRPSAYAAPDELVHVERRSSSVDAAAVPWPYDHYRQLRERTGPFTDVAAFGAREVTLSAGAGPERVRAEFITDNYLSLLGVAPAVGRGLRAAADVPEALLAHRFWREHFAGAADVVGTSVRIDGRDVHIAGVLPAGFRGESGGIDVWLPVAAAPLVTGDASLMQPFVMWLHVIGRMQPGIAHAAAESHLAALNDAMVEAGLYPLRLGRGTLAVTPVHGSRVEPALRSALLIVFAAAVAVLMIACLNIGSLLLARSRTRRREIAVRRALGATSWKLAQQFMAEGVVLAAIGGVIGLAVAMWLLDVLRALQPAATPGFWSGYARALAFHDLTLDMRVLRFTLLVTLGSGFVFGLLPALRSGLPDLTRALKDGGGVTGEDRRHLFNLRSVLVVGEVALALMLLAGAGLLTRSFLVAHTTNFGFSADDVVTMRLQLPQTQYPMDRVPVFAAELQQRIRGIAGVSDVGISSMLPLTGGGGTTDFVPEGHSGADLAPMRWAAVTPEYFAALGIRLRSGRFIAEHDIEGAPRVAVINAALARTLFPGEDPVGRHADMTVAFYQGDAVVEIVGVVDDVQYGQLDAGIEPLIYIAYAQRPVRSLYVTARAGGGMAATALLLRQQVAALDPELAVTNLMPMRERVSNAASRTRFGAVLVSMFAALAGVLAALGIYGVMATAVAARTREVAIRMALGGRPADVLRTVMREGVALMAVGIGCGLAGAFATTRLLRAHLFGVEPHDPLTFALVVTTLGALSLLAAYLPALRATRVEPMLALRQE